MATKKTTTENVKEAAKKILSTHMTEKASLQSEKNAYTFVVAKNATKHAILAEIKKEYKVTPIAVNITNMPRKNTFIRGKFGTTEGKKKAIVFLKKGDSITLA